MRLVNASIDQRPVAKSSFNIREDVFPQGAIKGSALCAKRDVRPDGPLAPIEVEHIPTVSKRGSASPRLFVAAVGIAGVILGFVIGRNRRVGS
jgi:hypothetical protein